MKKNRPLFFLILLALLLNFFVMQGFVFPEDSSSEYRLNKEYLKNFGNDFVEVVSSPKSWGKKDVLSLWAVLGAGMLVYAVDQDVHQWSLDRRSTSSDDAWRLISNLGHGTFLSALIATMYVTGEISDDNSLRKTALLSLEGWLTSGIVVQGMKFISGRARPHTEEKFSSFHPFSSEHRYHSFPSGHASSAFAVAAVIANQSEKFSIDFLAYSLAALAAVSRVHNNEHWMSDVFIGSVIGYLVGNKISALNKPGDSNKVRLSFQFSPKIQALNICVSF